MIIIPDIATPERKVPVIVRKDYTVSLERTSGMTFIHCDIHAPWTRKVQGALRQDWWKLRLMHEAPIYALHTPGDRKHEKFLGMFGFRFADSYADPLAGVLHIYKI